MTRRTILNAVLIALLMPAPGLIGLDANPLPQTAALSAFQLVQAGNRYIGDQARDKVVHIRSERSVGSLTPSVWYVVYYDYTAALKATEVKFANGKMLDVKRPLRLLSATSRQIDPLPKEKLKIDSDEALAIATRQPALENVTLKASEMRLERGRSNEPIWRIQLWALGAKAGETSIGDVTISAAEGQVIQNDLKPEKVLTPESP